MATLNYSIKIAAPREQDSKEVNRGVVPLLKAPTARCECRELNLATFVGATCVL